MFIPIRTETTDRHAPIANLALLVLNIAVFAVLDLSSSADTVAFKLQHFVLDAERPVLYTFLTYQFGHADIWHLAANLLFLWVFGNPVNSKLGDVAYLIFYLTGGIFAGLAFVMVSDEALLGASGSIAAVTTAYLVLFPRSRVLVLYWLFILFGFVEIPAIIVIGLKIILWDNVLAPHLGMSDGQVAHVAHLAGYFFGFVLALAMLLVRAVPRDQFDLLALLKRWNQRRAHAAAMTDPQVRAQAEYGRVARIDTEDAAAIARSNKTMQEQTELRTRIAMLLREQRVDEALDTHEALQALGEEQCLAGEQQLAIGRAYYDRHRWPESARVYESYLATYRAGSQANEVRLLLGILEARELKAYASAEKHLQEAFDRATNANRRQQAADWLAEVRALLQQQARPT